MSAFIGPPPADHLSHQELMAEPLIARSPKAIASRAPQAAFRRQLGE